MKKTYIFILGIIFGLAISGVSVFATTLLSKDISFTPTKEDWQVTNVEDAITDLYDYSRQDTMDRLDFTTTTSESYGERLADRNISLSLEAGNYIIVSNYTTDGCDSITTNGTSASSDYPVIGYTNGECTKLAGKTTTGSASQKYGAVHLRTHLLEGIWKCNFNDSTVVTLTANANDDAESGQVITAYAIKLN